LLLPIAQLAYNNKKAESTGVLPHYAYYRIYLNLFKRSFPSLRAKAAIKTAEEIKKVYYKITIHLQRKQY
jgi:hypothetical protein